MDVLIVDDEQTALKNLTRVLKKVAPEADIQKTDDVEEALELCRRHAFDVVFLDIRMPDKDGLTLAKDIKNILPVVNIVIVTAYPEYALNAYKLYVSDYVLKPVIKEDLRKTLDNLRNPVKKERKGLYVQCFGDFAVFFNGMPLSFGRAKTKEMFAYLIDRKGAQCTNAQIRAALWGDKASDDERQRHYFAQIAYELRSRLEELGLSDIYIQKRNAYAIVPEKIPCDYYQALENKSEGLVQFEGEYMAQYEWAEVRLGFLNKTKET
ncbi:MAG: response regulator [Lachnospiraceae bacterium]|nr:response regulator [Lachnospiraceae bacterium]